MGQISKKWMALGVILVLLSCEGDDTGFSIKKDGVREGEFRARVKNSEVMISNYPMNRNPGIPQPLIFKLSLNGADNEAGFGVDHHIVIPEGISEFYAPQLIFGKHIPPGNQIAHDLTAPATVHFRVDMRPILSAFDTQGFFVTPTQDTVSADAFTGLYIAGNTAPLSWIWDEARLPEHLRFHDHDQDSIFELSLRFAPPDQDQNERQWALGTDLSSLPQFSSPKAPILESITNLALEEVVENIRDDNAFSAGAEWSGVWTRDVSFAAQLSLAYLFPEHVKTSLRAKLTPEGRIVQDTGTGGAWPVSSDRFTWVLAAWEVFLATGDRNWLDEIRMPVLTSLQEDLIWNRDPVSGMLLGETSFEDWREQTYPPWMTPSQIHASHALSTNIIFKRALEIGLAISDPRDPATRSWPQLIERLDQALLTHFWNEALNAPSSYIMSTPAWLPSPQRDLLGESLAILYCRSFSGVAADLVASYPRSPYGSPVISHQLPHAPPYHNKAIWPFVEAYGMLAAKETGNQAAFAHGFNGLIRAAALFLSHRENYEFSSGRPDLTQINSDRQLWSDAGWLAAVYKGLFGINVHYQFGTGTHALQLTPSNPFEWDEFHLTNLSLQKTSVDLHLYGHGSIIQSIVVNGHEQTPGTDIPLTGEPLDISIRLEESNDSGTLLIQEFMLPSPPEITWNTDTLHWENTTGLAILELNGGVLDTVSVSPFIQPDTLTGFFTLRTWDPDASLSSLPTEPKYLGASASLILTTEAPYYVDLGTENRFIRLGFSLPSEGNYLMRFIYSNGAGPINTGSTCGLAKLSINDWWLEQMVSFPHTGTWDTWEETAWVKAFFKSGNNQILLDQDSLPVNNMDGMNHFLVQSVEIVPLSR